MSKFYISFSIVVFLFFFLPSIHSQEKEGGGDGQGDESVDKEGESSGPVITWIKAKAEDSIAKIGWHLMREVDGKVIYEVQLRQRIEGKAGDWRHEAETAKTYVLVDGLKPNTTYDVKIRGWIGGKAGKWEIHENAFKTSSKQGDGEGREDGERDVDEDGEGENGDRDKDKGGEGEDGEREGDEGDNDRDGDRDDEGGDGERDGDEDGDNGEGEKGARVVDGDGEGDKRDRKNTIQMECKIVSGNKMRLSWPVSNEQNVLGEQYVLESMDSLNNSKDNSKWKPTWTAVFRTKDKWVLDIPIKKTGMKFFRVIMFQ